MQARDDIWLTADEAADRFEVGRRTILRWANTGKLRGKKMPGGQWRFSELEVDRWLKDAS